MEVVFGGFGGQGVLTAGLIVAESALQEYERVTWMPAYGPSMRGGKAFSVVKYSDEEIGNPSMEEPDVLVAMNGPSLEFAGLMNEGATIVVNKNNVSDEEIAAIDPKFNVVALPFMDISNEIKNPKGATIVAIGAMIKKCNLFTLDAAKAGLDKTFAKKGKNKFAELNEKALLAGYNAV